MSVNGRGSFLSVSFNKIGENLNFKLMLTISKETQKQFKEAYNEHFAGKIGFHGQ